MCRIKKANTNYSLYSNQKLIKEFKNKSIANIYVKEFKLKNCYIEEEIINGNSKIFRRLH